MKGCKHILVAGQTANYSGGETVILEWLAEQVSNLICIKFIQPLWKLAFNSFKKSVEKKKMYQRFIFLWNVILSFVLFYS